MLEFPALPRRLAFLALDRTRPLDESNAREEVELAEVVTVRGASGVLSGKRILIAEDESLIALELESALDDLGCEVVGPVARASEALRHAESGTLDGALLDVNLRGEQIFPVLPHLVRLGLPFIITSGYDDVTLFPPQFRDVPRIAKPIDPRALARMCIEVFGNKAGGAPRG